MALFNNGLDPNFSGGTTSSPTTTSTSPTSGFYKYNTDYNGMSKDTVYNATTNQPYSSGQDFLNAGGTWDAIQTRTVPVSLNPSTTTTTSTLNQTPTTANDIQTLIKQNQDFQQKVLGLYTPTPQEQAVGQQYTDLANKADSTQLNALAGIQNIEDKPIPMEFITGQQASVERRANLQLQTLGVQQNAAARQLQNLQSMRQSLLQAGNAQIGFNQNNIATQLQLQQIDKEEQAQALKMALDYNIKSPYFAVGTRVYDTASGHPFTSEQDFLTKTGMNVGDAEAKGLIQHDLISLDERKFQAELQQQQFENSLAQAKLAIDKSTSGLTSYQLQQSLNGIVDDYRMDPNVKNFTQAASGFDFIRSIDTNTSNPADDIGMIYAFAKIMDPSSVVREGEYATVQRYAQSWADSFGFKAERIFSNTNFLTPEALANMKATAEAKYKSLLTAYQQSLATYQQRQQDLMSGKIQTTLPDYTLQGTGSDPYDAWLNDALNATPEDTYLNDVTQSLDLNAAYKSGGLQ